MGNGDCKFHRAQRVSSPWMVSSFEPRWIEQDPAFRPGRGLVHRDFMIAEVWVPQQSNSRRGHWFQKEKAPPDDGAKDCHAWGYARVTQSKPHPFTFAGQHVQIGAGYNSLALRRSRSCPAPGPLGVRTHGGSGRSRDPRLARSLPWDSIGASSESLDFLI